MIAMIMRVARTMIFIIGVRECLLGARIIRPRKAIIHTRHRAPSHIEERENEIQHGMEFAETHCTIRKVLD